MLATEAAGLAWLAEGGARVPAVIAADGDVLVLSWAEQRPPSAAAAARFGRSLARLHLSGAPAFGAPPPGVNSGADGWIGSAGMSYAMSEDWPSFFAEHRILPYAQRCAEASRLRPEEYATIRRVCDRIHDLSGPRVAPARLHGDLWAGNLLWQAESGLLIDPAAHGGHPESDLAMLQLFPPARLDQLLAGYRSVRPLPEDWRSRTALHQLYPLLVHAELFGGRYGAAAAAAAARVLATLSG